MKIQPSVKRLLDLVQHDINGYESDDECGRAPMKEDFLRTARAVAKLMANGIGLPLGSFDIRMNRSGVAGSGSITLHGETIYIQLEQGSFRDLFMFRACLGRADYGGKGGPNEWMRWEDLRDWDAAIARFRTTSNRRPAAACETRL